MAFEKILEPAEAAPAVQIRLDTQRRTNHDGRTAAASCVEQHEQALLEGDRVL
jgi:hypothetical protein